MDLANRTCTRPVDPTVQSFQVCKAVLSYVVHGRGGEIVAVYREGEIPREIENRFERAERARARAAPTRDDRYDVGSLQIDVSSMFVTSPNFFVSCRVVLFACRSSQSRQVIKSSACRVKFASSLFLAELAYEARAQTADRPCRSPPLWTAIELFVLVSIHREKAAQKLVLIPLDPTSDRARVFGGFDIRTARCTRPDDRHALLAVIEASFGDLDAFNRVLRTRLIDVERQHADARVAVGE